MEINLALYIIVAAFIFVVSSLGFNPRNFFGPAFGGWTEIPSIKVMKIAGSVFGVISFLFLSWGLINLPELRFIMIIYLFLHLGTSVVLLGEMIAPEKYPWALLGGDPKKESIALGIFLGIIWIILSIPLMLSSQISQSLSLMPSSIQKLFLVSLVFIMTFYEESSFAGVTLSSLAETLGIIPALILNAFFFGLFHYTIYQADLIAIAKLICFRISADSLNFRTRSIYPSMTAHLFINLISIIYG